MTRTYTYKAAQPNESISGTISGYDYDESCQLIALVTAKSLKFGILTQSDRDALESSSKNMAIVSASSASVAALCTAGVITGPICGAEAGILAAITGVEAVLLDKLATDPSDPNFTVIANPAIKVPTLNADNSGGFNL